jgi:glycolate oxidase
VSISSPTTELDETALPVSGIPSPPAVRHVTMWADKVLPQNMLNTDFTSSLERIVGPEAILRDPDDLLTYESDGLVRLRAKPGCVVLPSTAGEVQQIVRLCHSHNVPFVPRGHGTGLSGGALPVPNGLVIGLSRLNRVIDVDIPNQRVTVEPGVINLDVTKRVALHGFYYAPDPRAS